MVRQTARSSRGAGAAGWCVVTGLLLGGLGFVVAAIVTGDGPRLVPDSREVAGVYAPPAMAGLVVMAIGVVVGVLRRRLWYLLGGLVGAVLLIGSFTVGWESLTYRLTDPGTWIPFTGDVLQLTGELLAVAGAILVGWRSRK